MTTLTQEQLQMWDILKSTYVIDEFGNKRWYNEAGQRHRDNDLPAVEYADGSKFWHQNGTFIKSTR